MKPTKVIASLLAVLQIFSVSALSINTSGGTGQSEATLTQAATQFSVSLPTALPVSLSKTGEVTTADNAKLMNHSFGPVVVSNITITGENGWTNAGPGA